MAKIIFYASVERNLLETVEFYKQDIDALKSLGHRVIICTKYYEIPYNYDLMFIWWWTKALWPVLLSHILKKPSIITGTFNFRFPKGFEGVDYFKRPNWQRCLIKIAAKACTKNLFVNTNELESCTRYFNLKNGYFYPHTVHSDYLRGPGKPANISLFNLVLSSKKSLKRKGIPELLRAIKILKDEGVSIDIKLAGHTGDGVEYLLDMINKLGINNEVSYLGEISRKRKIELMRNSAIYVQPSHYEGFGVAIAEAMGCGACIITCDVGAVRSVVGDAGIYVPQGSPKELAKAIKKVLSDEAMRNQLQEKAYRRAYENFSEEKKIERLNIILSELLKNR